MPTQSLPAIIETHSAVEQIDAQEDAGDRYACLDDNTCIDPGGHLFKMCQHVARASCCEARCIYCGEVVWS